jgi:hypothetical protein
MKAATAAFPPPVVMHAHPPRQVVLGTSLPFVGSCSCYCETITLITSYSIPEDGLITSWKTQFCPAYLCDDGTTVLGPTKLQLKTFREIIPGSLEAVNAGNVQDPRADLQRRFGPIPQAFPPEDSVTPR